MGKIVKENMTNHEALDACCDALEELNRKIENWKGTKPELEEMEKMAGIVEKMVDFFEVKVIIGDGDKKIKEEE